MPQRVLLLVTDLEVGGTPHVVRDLAIRLRSPERIMSVACIAPWGPVAGEVAAAGIRVRALGARHPLHLPRVVHGLSKLAGSCDVLLSFLIHSNFIAALATRGMPGVRLIQSIQTTQVRPYWHWLLQGLIAPAADTIVVPSVSVKRNAVQRCEISPGQVRVIPNAVETALFDGPRRPGPGGVFRVGFLGRLDPVKRIGDLVRAVKLVPQAELHIYGDGGHRALLEKLIRQLHIGDRVILHGTTPNPADALRSIDALVLPSDAEGFGLVLIEAMAAGTPVIGTDADGIRDVVQHEKTGLLVPRRSPEMIAHAIERLMNDPALCDRLREAGRIHVRHHYAWPAVLAQYDRLLSGSN